MARPHGTCDGLAWDTGCYCYHMSVGNLWLTCLRGKGNSVWFATLAASNLTQLPSHMNTAACRQYRTGLPEISNPGRFRRKRPAALAEQIPPRSSSWHLTERGQHEPEINLHPAR